MYSLLQLKRQTELSRLCEDICRGEQCLTLASGTPFTPAHAARELEHSSAAAGIFNARLHFFFFVLSPVSQEGVVADLSPLNTLLDANVIY